VDVAILKWMERFYSGCSDFKVDVAIYSGFGDFKVDVG